MPLRMRLEARRTSRAPIRCAGSPFGRIDPLRGHADVVFGPALGEGRIGWANAARRAAVELDQDRRQRRLPCDLRTRPRDRSVRRSASARSCLPVVVRSVRERHVEHLLQCREGHRLDGVEKRRSEGAQRLQQHARPSAMSPHQQPATATAGMPSGAVTSAAYAVSSSGAVAMKSR